MSSLEISLIVFVFLTASALLGLFLKSILPAHHLEAHSKDAIKVGAGLIATLTALVLGLLVSSAKSSYDAMNDQIKQFCATVVVLDHVLAQYGQEAEPIREMVKNNLLFAHAKIWPSESSKEINLQAVEKAPGMEAVREKIMELHPKSDKERALQADALAIGGELTHLRWQLIEHESGSIPVPFLVVLVFWLAIFFVTFGLLSPVNGTIIAVMIVCTLSVAGALFLILEMNMPLEGLIKISDGSLLKALQYMNVKAA